MDLLEEFLEKKKQKMRNARLVNSLVLNLLLAFTGAIAMYILTRNLCEGWIRVLLQRYPQMDFYNDLLSNLELFSKAAKVSPGVELGMILLQLLYRYSLIPYTVVSIVFTIRHYSKNRIETAVEAITTSLGYLQQGDYGHEPIYQSEDEFGIICTQLENLRQKLLMDKHMAWDSEEEQRSINAMFAHDMRTPLTVMKGYTEFLQHFIPQGKVDEQMLLDKLKAIHGQQDRLYEFSKTMTQIQKLGMAEIHCAFYSVNAILERLRETAQMLEKQTQAQSAIHITTRLAGEQQTVDSVRKDSLISLDLSLLLEVCENLLTNALRYAKSNIWVTVEISGQQLTVFVKDDGKGFSPRALREGAGLYFSEAKEAGEHFGMGLYICKKLCEKHGGALTLINSVDGGAIASAMLRIQMK